MTITHARELFPIVILAGGLATRLHPITAKIPKSLVEINDEPFIAHQLRLLRSQGIKKIIICVGYLGEQIIEKIGNGDQFDLTISYVFDGPSLLGTAGAIKSAWSQLPDNFFVLYGDSYLPCNYASIQSTFIKSRRQALMTVFKNEGQWDTSNVEFKYGQIIQYDKKNKTPSMQHIDYGLGIFNKNVFMPIPDKTEYDLALVYQTLIVQQELAAHEVTQRFYEVGSFTGITELENYLRNHKQVSLNMN
ncbi:MAG: NTP transferase domain-containing protein [Gammaproteobacteria bacterium]|nr:NTP transferase domain-containing protein [Gammaproteobacteria bacterium]